MTAVPLYATSRRLERSTAALRAVEVAEALGIDLMAWQRQVLDVALELDDAGRLAWRNVCVSTPRRQGKSTLMFVIVMWRLLTMPDQTILFGAQNRQEARGRLLDIWWRKLARSPFADELTVSKGAGFEAIRCSNGSILRLLSSEESSGHGADLDLALLDECWATAAWVESSVRPATLAQPEPQLYFLSTAGTAKSVWWNEKVAAGRLAVAEGSETFAHFEWSAADDADPADPATWAACMPALGLTVNEAAVRADFEVMSLPEFTRAYLNRAVQTDDAGWRVVSKEVWEKALQPW